MYYSILERNKIIMDFKRGTLSLEDYCKLNKLKEILLINWLKEESSKYTFIPIENNANENEFFYIRDKKNKQNICKIKLYDSFETNVSIDKDDYEKIDIDIFEKNIIVLKFKFINLNYESISADTIFDNISIVDEHQNFFNSLNNSSLRYSKFGENIGYTSTYEKRYLPKIVYNVTLLFSIPKENKKYLIAIKDYDIDGNTIKDIFEESETTKKLRQELLNIKCPNCNSHNFIKAGHKGEKQRYQCKECNRKFVK